MATSTMSSLPPTQQQQSTEPTISPRIVAQLKKRVRKRSLKVVPSDPALNPPPMSPSKDSKKRSSSLVEKPPSSQ